MGRVFANGPQDRGSSPGWVIWKTQKMVLDVALLNTWHYKVWIKGKVGNPEKGVAPSPTSWCSSCWKGSLWVSLNYGRQLFLQHRLIGIVGRVFSNGLGDRGSSPGWVIPKTQRMVLDVTLLNTRHYKVQIKSKVEQSREWSCIPPYTSVW